MKRIIFYSHARLGDLHVSRGFVKAIAKHAGVPCHYYGVGAQLLADCGVSPVSEGDFEQRYLLSDGSHHLGGDALYINTWYAAGQGQYVRDGQAALFDTLYRLFDDAVTSHLGRKLSDLGAPASFLPDIDLSRPEHRPAHDYLSAHPVRLNVLVANGRATAGQAELFPMLPPLAELGRKYPDARFIYTNKEHEPALALPPNVVFSRDVSLIPEPTIDLNTCGALSTHCHLIVGRFSGAYTFSLIKPNLLTRPVRFLTFSNVTYPTWLGPAFRDSIPLSCRVVQCRGVGHKVVIAEMQKLLGEL